MIKFKKVFCFSFLLIIISCNKKEKAYTSEFIIKVRNFNFTNPHVAKYDVKVKKSRSNNSDTYVYGTDEIDTLKIKNDTVYFNSVQVKKIDSKNIKFKDSILTIDKFYFKSKETHSYEMYLFISRQKGLIFAEALNSGFMVEYDTETYNEIHKQIALKQLNFKDGEFELKYARRNYPELKE